MEKKLDCRVRNFATVVYPESAPSNWQEILQEEFVPVFISPLHNMDINPTGEKKKEHYHVIVMFEGKKSLEQVTEIFSKIGGVGLEKINSLRGYARYLCHLDNPEKYQYPQEEIIQMCGADYPNVIGLITDKYKCISQMVDFCEQNKVVCYADLFIYCKENRYDWFRVLCDNGTVVIKEYLKSRYWSMSK